MKAVILLLTAVAVMLLSSVAFAQAQVSAGVSLASFQVGKGDGLFGISPHAGLAWRTGAWRLESHYTLLLIPERSGVGHTHQLLLGGGGELFQTGATLVLGVALTAYRIVACGEQVCGPVLGVAAGAHARVDYDLKGPFGIAVAAGADWFAGRSLALPGSLAVTFTAGPRFTFGGGK